MEELPLLLVKTILFRPYVFAFLAAFLFIGRGLLGWRRTGAFLFVGWVTAFVCEFSSTRVGVPFGFYYYNGSTVGRELYLADVPFMDSLSFTFLLFASYCMALIFILPVSSRSAFPGSDLVLDPVIRTSWPVLVLAAAFLMFIDVVIDPLALRGDRWFLGLIYGYPEPGLYFGIPLMNFLGWAVVGLIALSTYFTIDRRLPPVPIDTAVTRGVLLGCALYYIVLFFNLSITFWIGEALLGLIGVMIYLPVTLLFALRLLNRAPTPVVAASTSQPGR